MQRIDAATQRRYRMRNAAQAALLLGGMVLMLSLCAWLLAGPTGVLWVTAVGAVALLLRPHVPPGWVLSMYGARTLPQAAAPDLHRLVRLLAERAALPRHPSLHYVPTSMLNAFAVGRRDDATIGVTDGLLRNLTGASSRGCSRTRSPTSAPTICG